MICEYLVALTTGQIRKLIINVPPRTAKSRFATVCWPVWRWTLNPGLRWMFLSYAKDLTLQHSKERRDLIESEWFQRRWSSRFQLAVDQNVKTWYANDHRGQMFSSSIGGTVIGKGGDVVVLDDPEDPERAHSETERKATHRFIDSTVASRLDDPKTGTQLLVQQRLHEDDSTAHAMEAEGWTLVKLPMEAEGLERITYPISGKVHERQDGELLFPARFGPKEVRELKAGLRHNASGQLQQRPTPAEGTMIKRDWWQYYDEDPEEIAKLCDVVIQSWDMSFQKTTDGSFVAAGVWGRRRADANGEGGGRIYLFDEVHDRMDFPTTCKELLLLTAKWPKALEKIVEKKANGPAVIDQLKNTVQGLIAWPPKGQEEGGSKEERMAAVSPTIEAGNVYLPRRARWTKDYVDELAAFPLGGQDDRVDQTSQALRRLTGYKKFNVKKWADALQKHGAEAAVAVVAASRPAPAGIEQSSGTAPGEKDPRFP